MAAMQANLHPEEPVGKFLDRDTPDTVRLGVAEARVLGERALRRIGYTEDETGIIVDQLIDNALCGYRFAGLPRILAIADDERTRSARYPVKIVRETPTSALLDGGNNVGYIAVHHGAGIAIDKARQNGLAAVGIYNSYYSGRSAYFVERIARAGLVAIHTACAEPRVLPSGGARPALGPNPICFGFPSSGDPVVFDMATASLNWGEVLLYAHVGKQLPEGVGFDAEGRPTRDAKQAMRGGVAPFGGHKGYGLSFSVQALGVLAGAFLTRGEVQDFSFLFLVIDPNLLHPGGQFADWMSELVDRIKATPRQPGVEEIRIPSERAFRERERRRKEGIVLDRKVVESLNAL